MINYFTLLDNLQEMLQSLKSISTCSIVFNQKSNIIDMNQSAADFLKIKNIEDYTSGKLKIDIDKEFYNITERVIKGEIITNEKFNFKTIDENLLSVNLKVTLFYGLKDIFIFQFSEKVPHFLNQR